MATIEEKTARLHAAGQKAEAFIAAGGDLKSKEAVPIGMELIHAANEVAKELGYEFLKPINKPGDFVRPDPASSR